MAEVVRYVDPDASGAGDGTSWTDAYTSLSAWESGEQTDLVTAGDWHHVYCRSSSGSANTTATTINGWTTGVSNYILIEAADGDEASTSWESSRYRISVNAAGYAVTISNAYVTIRGIQIENSGANGSCLYISANNCTIDSCFIDGHSNGGNGIYQETIDVGIIVNTIVVRCSWAGVRSQPGIAVDVQLYNLTVINCGDGIRIDQYRVIQLTNCYAGGCTTDYNCGSNRDPVWTTCYSEDGTGTTTTAACSTSAGAYFTNITSGSEDVSIKSDSSLIGNGTDLSSDGEYAFSDDIDGTTRSDWDVGAYEYTSGGGTAYPWYYYAQQ